MKEKFSQQIDEIERCLPGWALCGRSITIPSQQQARMTSLINCLRKQVEEQLNFKLFSEIMGDKEYDTQIYYNTFQTSGWTFEELKRHAAPIPELQQFFENPERTNKEKKAIEEIIIFGFFLQATYDYFCTPSHCFDYFYLLDNLSYKCNPTAYKLLTSLNYIALWLALSSLAIVPLLALSVLSWPTLPVLACIVVVTLLVAIIAGTFIFPAVTSVCGIWGGTANKLWGTNWAYSLPDCATDDSPNLQDMHPYAIGIFPSFFGYPKIPAGSSFKVMNRLGFFPFKEIANEVIAVAKREDEQRPGTSKRDTGKISVDLSNCSQPVPTK